MTNLAPLFGVKIGEAYITASTNYLDVVALHSVVMFVPLFVGWAVILSRYAFSPFAVFVLFGLTGTVMETNLGTKNPLEFGLWIFVYGLMVFLPAYCVPAGRKARVVRWWHYPLAVFVPFLFIPIVPLPLLAGLLCPHHPKIHFEQGNHVLGTWLEKRALPRESAHGHVWLALSPQLEKGKSHEPIAKAVADDLVLRVSHSLVSEV